jgi:hypothetical protein
MMIIDYSFIRVPFWSPLSSSPTIVALKSNLKFENSSKLAWMSYRYIRPAFEYLYLQAAQY